MNCMCRTTARNMTLDLFLCMVFLCLFACEVYVAPSAEMLSLRSGLRLVDDVALLEYTSKVVS